jgi:hypothetical protein
VLVSPTLKIVSGVKRCSLVAFDNKLNNFEKSALLKPFAWTAAVIFLLHKDMFGCIFKNPRSQSTPVISPSLVKGLEQSFALKRKVKFTLDRS